MLWDLPGPSKWVQAVAAERGQGLSGIVLWPGGLHEIDVSREFSARCPRGVDHFDVRPCVSLSQSKRIEVAVVRLASELCEQFGLDSDADVGELCRHPDLGRTSFLIDARDVDIHEALAWAHFAAAFAAAGREMPYTTRPTFWAIICPSMDTYLPASDVSFAHRWWWGVLGPLDAALTASEHGLSGDGAAIAAEFGRWDVELVSEMAHWDGSVAGIIEVCKPVNDLENRVLPAPAEAGFRPPVELMPWWSDGLVQAWDGYVSIHVALEAAIRSDAFIRRIWVAQVGRVLPFIELERARLADWFAAEVATAGGPLGEWRDQDIAALEIGPLWACVAAHRRVRLARSRLELIRDLRDARNSLAHRTPLNTATIQALRMRALEDRAQ
ncbi:MAG: hypothetical protein M3256_05665 [Actinomycetota bacterium]|nr:hypothetical protein [Actinomycetota bacterium]